jgi:hypothetical protein
MELSERGLTMVSLIWEDEWWGEPDQVADRVEAEFYLCKGRLGFRSVKREHLIVVPSIATFARYKGVKKIASIYYRSNLFGSRTRTNGIAMDISLICDYSLQKEE